MDDEDVLSGVALAEDEATGGDLDLAHEDREQAQVSVRKRCEERCGAQEWKTVRRQADVDVGPLARGGCVLMVRRRRHARAYHRRPSVVKARTTFR